MSKIDGNVGGTPVAPPLTDAQVGEVAKQVKAMISTDNSFGTGKADSKEQLAQAMGLVKAAINATDLASMMMSLRSKTENAQLKASSENVQAIKEKKATIAQERIDKFTEMIEKMEKSNKAGTIGKIFGWIAAAAMITAGVLLLAAGGAGTALIIAGAAMIAVMALQESGAMDAIMEGLQKLGKLMGMNDQEAAIFATAVVATAIIAVSIAAGVAGGPAAGMAVASTMLNMLVTPENLQAMGVPEDKAAAVSMGLSIGLALFGVAGGIGSAAGSSGKVAQLASKGSTFAKGLQGFANAGKGMKLAAAISQRVPQGAQALAKTGSFIAQGIGATATIGGGVSTIEAARHLSDAKKTEADSKELEAFLAKMQAQFDEEAERIEEILARLDELTSAVLSIFQGDAALFEKTMQI